MTYKEGIPLLSVLESLKDKDLLKSPEWRIHHIALLPSETNTLIAYTPALDGYSSGHWLANGVNHKAIYEMSGLYRKSNGTNFNDNLVFYALLSNKSNPTHAEYKAEPVFNLIQTGEIAKEDIPTPILHALGFTHE